MQEPAIPDNEDLRYDALCRLEILDTEPEERFDRLTRLAKQLFDVPIALVSLVDSERQWFKSKQGLDAPETPRRISFCGHAILSDDVFYVPNTLEDSRFADNPLVTEGLKIRFYAGAPLIVSAGVRIGTLCIIDDKPRTFSTEQLAALRDLADAVQAELERTQLLEAAQYAARLAMVVQHTDNAVIITDAQGLVEWVNPAFVRITGFTLSETIGRKPGAFLQGPETDPATVALIRDRLLQGRAVETEILNYHRDGTTYWLSLSIQPIHKDDGSISHFIAIESDITERKKADEIQRRLKTTLDLTQDSIYTFSPDTLKCIYANRAAQELIGYSFEELQHLTPGDLKPVFSEARFRKKVAPLLSGEESAITFETSHQHTNGALIPVEVSIQYLAPVGEPSRFVIIVRDISERKRAEEKLKTSENRIRSIVDTVVDGIVSINSLGVIQTANPATEQMFGYSIEEMLGQNVRMLMPEPYYSGHDGYIHHYLNTGERRVIGIGREVSGKRKGGSVFPMELAVSEMQVGGERMFTGIVRDITDRKRLDQMKSEFISTVSHELRTPLTSIRGALGLVVGRYAEALPEKARSMLEVAERNSERLTLLINDILDLEKIESGRMQFEFKHVNLAELIKSSIEANEGYARQHDVSLLGFVEVENAFVSADDHRLMQVLANLISNAVKFSPKQGSVEVKLIARSEGYRISVRDYGPGIPEEFRERMFERFAQADSSDTREKGGTGLGLSITKAIVERHGGQIAYESPEGGGTEFFVELKSMLAEGPSVSVTRERASVLICEDNEDVANILSLMLEQEDLVCDIAGTAASARALLELNTYNLMLLDLNLPDTDGLELLREIRDQPLTRELPIIVVSGRAHEGRAESSASLHVVDWLQKPIDRERFSNSVQQALSTQTRPKVLHIEDDLDVVQIVRALLEDSVELLNVSTTLDARRLLAEQKFDLAILDLTLADGPAADLFEDLSGHCPVVIFSGQQVGAELTDRVSAALTKSLTSNEQLVEAIKHVLNKSRGT